MIVTLKNLTIPEEAQDYILPLIINLIPDGIKTIGITWENVGNYKEKTRCYFITRALSLRDYPTTGQLKDTLVREPYHNLKYVADWFFTRGSIAEEWVERWTAAFQLMTIAEQKRVWKRLKHYQDGLIRYVTKEFIPLALANIENVNKEKIITIAERRLKEGV